MNHIFFDTETTGLPKNWKAPMSQVDNWPRVIQLAWLCTDDTGEEISRGKLLIKPDGWVVPDGKFWQDNGFSQEVNMAEGIAMQEALDMFIADAEKSAVLVSHNMDFDRNVLGAEMLRYNKRVNKKLSRVCTKLASTQFCRLPGTFGGYKWPKLEELHIKLFGKNFDGAHDALFDVIACKDCYFELVRLGVINFL